jgi:hypothetical protein
LDNALKILVAAACFAVIGGVLYAVSENETGKSGAARRDLLQNQDALIRELEHRSGRKISR